MPSVSARSSRPVEIFQSRLRNGRQRSCRYDGAKFKYVEDIFHSYDNELHSAIIVFCKHVRSMLVVLKGILPAREKAQMFRASPLAISSQRINLRS